LILAEEEPKCSIAEQKPQSPWKTQSRCAIHSSKAAESSEKAQRNCPKKGKKEIEIERLRERERERSI
jgi:hypothetical protein